MKHSTYPQTLQDSYLSGWGIQPRLSPCPKQHRNLPWKEPRVTPVECIPPQSSVQSRGQALVHHNARASDASHPWPALKTQGLTQTPASLEAIRDHKDMRGWSPCHQVSTRLAQQRHWQSWQMVSLQGCTHHNLYQLWALLLTKHDTYVCVICISEMSNS